MVLNGIKWSYCIIVHDQSSSMLFVGWDGWDGYHRFIGHRSSKSTFGAKKVCKSAKAIHLQNQNLEIEMIRFCHLPRG